VAGRIYQLFPSEQNTDPDAPGGTLYYRVDQTESDSDALALVNGVAGPPATYNGTPQQKCMIVYKGGECFDVTATYGPIPPLATGLTIWDMDTTGGKEKRFQAFQTRYVQVSDAWLNTGGGAIDFKGAIGVNKDSIDGVEIGVPKMSLTAKRKYNSGSLPSNYVQQLYDLNHKTNAVIFQVTSQSQILIFQAGELLFEGAVITEATSSQIEIDYKFSGEYDRLSGGTPGPVTLQGFSEGLQKAGWDYAWMSYMDSTSGGAFVKVPQQYQSAQVYETGDFTILIL
jgi:hypothetical protein